MKLIFRGVRFKELEAILHFIYNGEVNVGQDELNEFLLVAEDLKIKGKYERLYQNYIIKNCFK